MRRIIVMAAVGLVGTGCYTYVPASLDEVSVGSEVRAHLSRAATDRFRETGVEREAVNGRLARLDSAQLVIETRAHASTVDLYGSTPLRQPVNLTPQDVVAVSVRRLHKTRTMAAVGLGVAAGVALVGGMLGDWFGGGDEDPTDVIDPNPEELRVPFRIRLGW